MYDLVVAPLRCLPTLTVPARWPWVGAGRAWQTESSHHTLVVRRGFTTTPAASSIHSGAASCGFHRARRGR